MKPTLKLSLIILSTLFACGSYAETNPDGGKTPALIDLSGRVADTEGKGIAGVQVTDGYDMTATGSDGRYTLKFNTEKSRFVYITPPADYQAPYHRYGHPLLYHQIGKRGQGETDFVLRHRMEAMDDYKIVLLGDIQISTGKKNLRINNLRDKIIPDVERFIGGSDVPCFVISVGDLVANDMSLFGIYGEQVGRLGVPVYNFAGNHDHDPACTGDVTSIRAYEDAFGPANYSFNVGKVHFVMLDDVLFTTTEVFERGLTDDILEWLRKDLSYVPKGSTLVLGMHIPLDTNDQKNSNEKFTNYAPLMELLGDYTVHVVTGHRHATDVYNYPEPYKIVAHLCPRTGGDHKLNGDYCVDGTPSGYTVFEVAGTDFKWYHKTVGESSIERQMTLFSPIEIGTTYLFANIWQWDTEWGTPEWWENGHKVADMQRRSHIDPNFDREYRAAHKGEPTVEMVWHMFRVKPSDGVTSGTVKVTDRFGKLHSQDISW